MNMTEEEMNVYMMEEIAKGSARATNLLDVDEEAGGDDGSQYLNMSGDGMEEPAAGSVRAEEVYMYTYCQYRIYICSSMKS